ncbi:MAG: RNA polymerase sigma factor [Acidimicrobiales bacterium]
MSSVALPNPAAAGAVRKAARGDARAFAELCDRHGQAAWRLAQAVAPDGESALLAVSDGLARAVRGARRLRWAGDEAAFGGLVLGAVYRAAMGRARRPGPPTPVPSFSSPATGASVVESAFRSLPERWRAAVWLTEVESESVERVSAVLGVSGAVAAQLVVRGRRGLQGRFAQARLAEPEHLGVALLAMAPAVPIDLAGAASARWKADCRDPAGRVAPIGGWVGEHAVRPLSVAVIALFSLGAIGIGVIGDSSAVRTGPVTFAPPATGTDIGVSNPAGNGSGGQPGALRRPAVPPGALLPAAGAASGALAAPPAVASRATSGSAGGSPSGGNTVSPSSGSALPAPTLVSPTTGTPPAQTTPPPSGGSTTPLVNLAPAATITQSGGTTAATVLPSSSGGAGSVTLGCSTGVGLTVGTVPVGCTASSS